MFDLLPTLNLSLAISSLLLTAITVAIFIDLFKNSAGYCRMLDAYAWPMIILTTVGGVILSLVYSEYFLFVPCSLCWLQRIALYPQALMAIIAHRRGDTKEFPIYGIALSTFGLLVGIYQYIYQLIPPETREAGFAPCLLDGSNADCAVKVIDEFGFVTFPFVSAVSFAFLIALYTYLYRRSR
jgi:disulfide bond formation protein DsbB